MIRSIIIDDEHHCIKSLENDLKANCDSIEVVASCKSAKEGILAIKKLQPDLVFLDVEMPWMNGFELLEMLNEINFSIIFTTAHDEFAAKAFRMSAIDYLLKPIDAGDLKEAVQKVERKINAGSGMQHIMTLLGNIRTSSESQKIALPQKDGYDFIDVASVIFCEANGAYTRIFIDSQKSILVSKSLGEIEELLPKEIFLRIHHSTLVNLAFISKFSRTDGGHLVLKTGEKLAVSKAKKEALMMRLRIK